MKVGILAAGEGSRLRAGGFHMPKPLLPIGGVPLIGRLLQALQLLAPEEIVCIINHQGSSVADYVRQHYPSLPMTFVQKDTASSYESFTVLCEHLHGAPFLVTTVDAVFTPDFLPQFVAAAHQQTAIDMVLALTTFVDDEKPLHVRLDARQRIRQIGEAAWGSAYVTSGFYYCAPSVSAACASLPPRRVSALREFLGWLLQQGYWLQGYLAPKMVDVDRPQDIAVAEQFVRESERVDTEQIQSPPPATASAEGAQLNGPPFPATASAEGAQFNGPPSLREGLRPAPTQSRQRVRVRGLKRPTMAVQLLGIYREKRFSPGLHAAGDAEILELTQAALERAGYRTTLVAPERLPAMSPTAQIVFSMCQSLEALDVLQTWEHQGALVLNTPAAVRACYRLALVTALSQTTLPFAHSVVVHLDDAGPSETVCPALPESATGWWVKRGDVHAMQSDDVVFVRHATDVPAQLVRLRQRGMRHAVVQEHVAGQECKFYAVRGHGVIHAFAPHAAHCPPIDQERLNTLAQQAGAVLGLDIYGGDCLVTPDGALCLIDINDWPSFRGCRPVAATHIAQHILTQAQQHGLL